MTGPELRAERERAGVSRTALARRIGRDPITIWRWEGQATVKEASVAAYLRALRAPT